MAPITGSQLLLVAAAVASFLSPGALSSPIFDVAQQVFVPSEPAQAASSPQKASRKLQGKFLHITDFHPDEYYKVHSSTAEAIACHRKKGPAGTYGAETSDCDSPMLLVNATLDWIRENVKDDIDFVVWTGDTARHDSDEKIPRNQAQVLNSNRVVTKRFIDTFSDNGKLAVPIIPTFGNNDFLPHNIFYPGPNKWLQAYSQIWKRFIPEEQRHSFAFGGWFEVEVIPDKLSVFSLNTMYFFDRNAGVDGCAEPSEPGFKHLEWLSIQLQRLRERGMKAILIGHVPPARTESKQNWDETCWQKYTLWLKQYRDVVTGSVYGHMNIDHFLLQDTKEIDLSLYNVEGPVRVSLEEAVSVESKSDYLQELRELWSDLPGSVARVSTDNVEADDDNDADYDDDDDDTQGDNQDDDVSDQGKKKKKRRNKWKKIGGKYAERYQLSFISPSIVPNFFPTIRIMEYNISGLEDTTMWSDSSDPKDDALLVDELSWNEEEEDTRQELKRDMDSQGKKRKKGKGNKGKNKHPKLVIPEGPAKGSDPGPAYMPQPLTLTGYTQYFANLTYLNNDMTHDVDDSRWRDGDFSDREPPTHKPNPREFSFEIAYSTFTDKIYKLSDLTVRSYLKLAYRIAKAEGKKGKSKAVDAEPLDDENDDDDFDYFEDGSVGQMRRKSNKVWRHFLNHAFVQTVPKKELNKMSAEPVA